MKKFWWLLLIPVMAITIGQRVYKAYTPKTLMVSARRLGTDTSSAISVKDWDEIMIFYDVDSIADSDVDTFACVIQTQDPLSENWVVLDSSNLNSGNITDEALVMKTKIDVLGETIRAIVVAGTGDSVTYSISVILK